MRAKIPAMVGQESRLSVGVDLRALVGTPTGIGFYTLALVERLASEQGLRIVGMAHREPQHLDELRAAGVEIDLGTAPSGVVWQQLVAPRRLRRGDIDVFWSPIFTLPLRCPVPAVTTVHDLTPRLHPEMHQRKVRWSILPFLGRNLSTAAAVVADSVSTASDLRRYYPACADRLEVIYPGVDEIFRPGSAEGIDGVRRELGSPDGYLLYAGTLEPRKNLDMLLDAWIEARRSDRGCLPLILTGPRGWAEESLFRRLEELEPSGVRWLGRLPRAKLVEVMQAATWFVYPSIYEGFGLGVAEAMACGVPAIATRVSSLPEIVGDAGYLVEPSDVAGLAELLGGLTVDDRKRLEPAAIERAARFDWGLASASLARTLGRAARASV